VNRTPIQAAADVADVLGALDLGVTATAQGGQVALTLSGRRRIDLDVVALAAPRPADVDRLVAGRAPTASTPILVADRLVPRVREQLSKAGWGWLDRRGHLRLVVDTLVIDTDLPALVREPTAARPALTNPVGLAVATALLVDRPTRSKSVRTLGGFTGHSIGAVHNALTALKREGLVSSDGLPVSPDLFWEVSAQWRPHRFPLRERVDEVPDDWALCSTLAAAAFGAPVVMRGDYPPDLYVADERTVRVCRQQFGDAVTYERRGATVAVPPVWWARARSVHVEGERWFLIVHPVIAALDLSVDEGRGREILDQWELPEPYVRVW
jgi:hypothetical protein